MGEKPRERGTFFIAFYLILDFCSTNAVEGFPFVFEKRRWKSLENSKMKLQNVKKRKAAVAVFLAPSHTLRKNTYALLDYRYNLVIGERDRE